MEKKERNNFSYLFLKRSVIKSQNDQKQKIFLFKRFFNEARNFWKDFTSLGNVISYVTFMLVRFENFQHIVSLRVSIFKFLKLKRSDVYSGDVQISWSKFILISWRYHTMILMPCNCFVFEYIIGKNFGEHHILVWEERLMNRHCS